MMSNNTVKPLELVVSAIHCLREKKGSSPHNILRYLAGKYNVDIEMLKPYVKTGLKRGVSFGLITHQSGLYRLNDILSAPLDYPTTKNEKTQRSKFRKTGGLLKKGKCRQNAGRKRRRLFKPAASLLQRNKRKMKKCKDRRKKTGLTSRRNHNEKRRKQKRQKTRGKKRLRQKSDKSKKIKKPENQVKPEDAENQNSEKEAEVMKDNVKM